jgi:hypothetical protein
METNNRLIKPINELIISNKDMYISCLEKTMFFLSHELRKPVANLLGLSQLLNSNSNSPEQIQKILLYTQVSASSIDSNTKVLSAYISVNIDRYKKGICF